MIGTLLNKSILIVPGHILSAYDDHRITIRNSTCSPIDINILMVSKGNTYTVFDCMENGPGEDEPSDLTNVVVCA